MNFSDKSQFMKGYFKIESLDKNGNVIDVEEKHNLITNLARVEFAKLLMGANDNLCINRFVMGTKGHVLDDVLQPKDADTGFTAAVTDIFSGQESVDLGVTWNQLLFTPSGNLVNTEALNVQDGSNNNSTVDISLHGVEDNAPYIQYIFNVAQDCFNGPTDGLIYTECGLYINAKLIAMRTFKGKVKESSVALRITWNLIF